MIKTLTRHLYRLLRGLSYPLRRNLVFAAFMYLLFCVARDVEGVDADVTGLYHAEIFFDIYLFCALLCLLPKKWRKWGRWAGYVVCYVAVVVESFLVLRCHLFYSPTTLSLLLETNAGEAGEFLASYLWSPALGKTALIYGSLLLFNIAVGLKLRGVLAFLRTRFSKGSLVIQCLDVLGAFIMIYCLAVSVEEKIKVARFLSASSSIRIERLGAGTFYSPLHRIVSSVKCLQVSHMELKRLEKRMHRLEVEGCSYRCPQIVLYIGESYNKHHAHLYGYALPTTPYMDTLQAKGHLARWDDAVSPWNMTSAVFKSILSTHGEDEEGAWTGGVLFPAVMRKAGYKVAFCSSQFYKTVNQGYIDFNGSFFLNDPGLDSLLFDWRNSFRAAYDGGLIRKLDDYVPGAHNLIIFHGMGQHLDYKRRFPAKEILFTPEDYPHRTDLNESEKQIVADYDNATRYNDKVFARLCAHFRKWDVVALYLSDHGDDVYDERHTFGRDHNAKLSPPLLRSQFEVPMVAWASASFRKTRPELWQEIKNAARKPFLTSDLPHLVLGLAGIKTPYYQKERDPLSPSYNERRPRRIKGLDTYENVMGKEYIPAREKEKKR